MKQFLSAPLPFVGQKRLFAREFIKVLNQYPDDTVFVDLFGGSGLLSHIAKRQKPNATVTRLRDRTTKMFVYTHTRYYSICLVFV